MTEADIPSSTEFDSLAAARLAAIVESSADAIVSKRLDGTLVSWNRAAEKIFGYTEKEIVGQSVYKLIPPELHAEEADILRRVSNGEALSHYETNRIRKDGRRITISLTVSPVLDTTGKIVGVASIKRDITEAKQMQQVLRQAARMEAIGRLAGGLAHDFNNHLHALSGFAHFIGRDPRLSPTSRQDLLQIQKVADRMASLTHQLLAFARQQVLTPEVLDLSAVVTDAGPMLQRLVGSNYDIAIEQGPGPRWVRVDRSQLIQVIMNLVINARDAMPTGGKVWVRSDTIEVAPDQFVDRNDLRVEAGAYAVLTVMDEGSGIGPDELQRIFEPFYTTKEVGRGTGLGLATVEGIVSQSRGHIQIDSTVGKGTTFTIMLPLSPPPTGDYQRPSLPRAGEHFLGRVLVVDDDEYVRSVVSRLLQGEGYEAITAADGAEALRSLELAGGAFDLVITDIVMPVMGGTELVQRLDEEYASIPIVLISGHPREHNQTSTDDRRPFLQKPIAPETLLQTVREIVRPSGS